ncbi:MAG: hypothetical protein IPK26_24595 [Planctomycetes bacterium]|nr:hypothetical protein [Planctomycetota bacterium]
MDPRTVRTSRFLGYLLRHERGHSLSCADHGVWLTAAVPPDFLRLPD